ncbi:uncharacterized protein LOC131220554 isoform X1 [Magnolia sinica]|uniref:uncharacterized protein LOC131220554 isoform X1 n=2 Tax=Magnolia sinica TaxID=86752 RepID=UPI002658007C|nr:uncharacterized protein LOC131220554 isoform X1 [Magnolia sinica]
MQPLQQLCSCAQKPAPRLHVFPLPDRLNSYPHARMDKYVVPRPSSPPNPKPLRRSRWKMSLVELNGRMPPKHRHEISALLLESYAEIGDFAHCYNIGGQSCPTHLNRMVNDANVDLQVPSRKEGISGLEFDTKGIYLASVTKSGCLTVHDFETLYYLSHSQSSCLLEDETKHLVHLTTHQQLDVVRWNIANQDEVACASMQSNKILLFDIGYISSEPVEVLKTRPTFTVHGSEVYNGLSDIAFISSDKSRLLASDLYGVIYVWDRRMSDHPCLELTTNLRSTLNSIQLNVEDRIVYGASKQGIIYAWDLRGGRTSIAFQSHKEVYYPPVTSVKLAQMLEKITSLKAQSDIYSKEIHSIDLDPSCPYQLAFHLDDGWSGVLNIYNFQVTHMHCPPPAWLHGKDMSTNSLHLRKPAWLGTCSIYAVGSSSDDGIHLLDFYPDSTSACHVDFNEETKSISEEENQRVLNKFIPLSKGVTACAAHPLNGTIIAGTKVCFFLVLPLPMRIKFLLEIK